MMVNLDEKTNTSGQSIFEHLKLETKAGGQDIRNRLQNTSSPSTYVIQLGRSLSEGVWRLARIPSGWTRP
jgi:hypothetical protein